MPPTAYRVTLYIEKKDRTSVNIVASDLRISLGRLRWREHYIGGSNPGSCDLSDIVYMETFDA